MAQFIISQALFKHFPTLRVGVVITHNFDNSTLRQPIEQKLKEIQAVVRSEFRGKNISELEPIKVWRQAYSFFGAKPKKHKSSVEALITRVMEGNDIPPISPLVDAYNFISLKYKLPLGSDDLDLIDADIKLTFAQGRETFKAINSEEVRSPEAGEVVYKKNNEILCRRWNWRESDLTKITENSKNAILYCESLLEDKTVLEKALRELQSLVGGKIQVLDLRNNALDLQTLQLQKADFNEFVTRKAATAEMIPPAKKAVIAVPQKPSREKEDFYHWTDVTAEKIIQEKGDKKKYTIAAGITPSGVVHIGNFREIITVDLVKRALEKRGKKVRFIYSWDNYDAFRKVPKNMPHLEELQQHLRKPITSVPDTFGCHASYAEHNQKQVEDEVPRVGIFPEFLYQQQKYNSGEYAADIKKALEHTENIKEILKEFREEPLDEKWLPISVFCGQCNKDTITQLRWSKGYTITYTCECGHHEEIDFREKPIVKLKWRIDWPMRWAYEQVDFEPGGKDHSTVGGSYDTGKQIVKLWDFEAPTYVMYDFINVKGGKGKMSSSSGDVVTLGDVLQVYEPEIVRYIFAGTRPNKEFAISFDADVLKVYEDFDKCERIYYDLEKTNEKDTIKQKAAYELSYIGKIPKSIPYQPGFRHLTTLLQVHSLDIDKTINFFKKELKNEHDKRRLLVRTECAKNWLLHHAPEEFKFTVQDQCLVTLGKEEKKILHLLAEKLDAKEWTDVELHEEMYILCKNLDFMAADFFKLCYRVLINRERGPRLASFILAIGKEKVAKLLKKV